MGALRRAGLREDGVAMLTVIILIAFLSTVSVALIDLVSSESTRSNSARTSNAAFQAAEAGLDDYLAKLVDDKTYYLHHVHPAESTRRSPAVTGTDVDPLPTGVTCTATKTGALGVDWTGTADWDPNINGKDNWCQLANGYEYNLEVTPPDASNENIQIVATGRKICTPAYTPSSSCAPGTSTTEWRAVQEWVHWSLLSDFQMITNDDYSAGAGATTNGKIYAGGDIDHQGTATANLYAQGSISGPASLLNGAKKYSPTTTPNINSQLAPISFSNFTSSLDDLKTAAISGGEYFDASYPVWKFVLLNNGKFTAQGCTLTGGQDPGGTAPTCSGPVSTYDVPTNGAVYVETKAIVSGTLNGRVTIAANDDMIVGGDIAYTQIGDDVLGLIGKNDVIIASWAPSGPSLDLTWRAAVIAQNGARHSWNSCNCKGTATHWGSSASNQHPFMDMFQTRNYNYDTTLQWLPPPWFPVLDASYTVSLFREVNP